MRVMKLRVIALALFALIPALASAASITVNWTAPTTAADGSPLTGPQALTSYQVWVSTSSIPTTTTAAPTATLTGAVTTTTQTINASPGATLYVRLKACNSAGCSDFSAEASKALPVTPPGVPTSITITVNVQ
jgi:hypothetical protein